MVILSEDIFAFNFISLNTLRGWLGRQDGEGRRTVLQSGRRKFLLTGNTLEIGNFAFTLIILERIYYLHLVGVVLGVVGREGSSVCVGVAKLLSRRKMGPHL